MVKPINPTAREKDITDPNEEERLNPGSDPHRVARPQPPGKQKPPNEAALPGSQNSDLRGGKHKRSSRD